MCPQVQLQTSSSATMKLAHIRTTRAKEDQVPPLLLRIRTSESPPCEAWEEVVSWCFAVDTVGDLFKNEGTLNQHKGQQVLNISGNSFKTVEVHMTTS